MTIDERVRDALHAYADPIEPAPGSWDRIGARLDESLPHARRPRTAMVVAAVGMALIVAVLAAALVRDLDDDSNVVIDKSSPTTAAPGPPAPPQRVLVFDTTATGGGSMEVLPSASRGSVGDMGSASDIRAGAPVAVTPDGGFAYVVRTSVNSSCGGDDSIFRQPIDPGARAGDEIPNATSPAVSPDGRYLAYLACRVDRDGPWLTVRDLQTGEDESAFVAVNYHAARLQFSPDSSRVLVASTEQSPSSEFEVVDGRLRGVGFDAPAASFAAAYWGADSVVVIDRTGRPATVLAVPRAGGEGRELFEEQGLGGSITSVVPNVAGTAMLVVVDDSRLWWWAPGMPQPAKLDDAMLGAAWMPDAAPTTSATLPSGIAAVRGNELVVLGATDGMQHSSLGPVASDTVIAPSADGRTWILGASSPPDRCDFSAPTTPPVLERLDTVSGQRASIVGAAYSPATNRDDVVAYGYACDGNGLGLTDLRRGENFRFDAIPTPPEGPPPQVRAVHPLGWSADGRELLYLARERHRTRLVVATFGAFEGVRLPIQGVDLHEAATVRAATMVGDSVVVASASDPTVLVEYRDGERLGDPRRLVELPGPVTSIRADPTGDHLLVVTAGKELWRWSRGEAGPAPVANNVTAAVWLPWS